MRLHSQLCALALPALLALVGCSAGGDGASDEQVGESTAALGEASCAYTGADGHFDVTIPGGYKSPTTYSNPKCYKAAVVEVENWPSPRADLIVADATLDSPNWHAPPPPSPSGPILWTPPTSARAVPGEFPLISQAACESRFLSAILYEDGVRISARQARGVWTPGSGGFFSIGFCARPMVTFGGYDWRSSDVDTLKPGHEYKVAATYRVSSATSAATLPLQVVTPPVACGQAGLGCCGADSVQGCDSQTQCQSGACTSCGHENEVACDFGTAGLWCYGTNHELTVNGGRCQQCGDLGQQCCRAFNCTGAGCISCSPGQGQCLNSHCANPPPPPPPAPPRGGDGQLCKPGDICTLFAQGCLPAPDGQKRCQFPNSPLNGCGGINNLCCAGGSCSGGAVCTQTSFGESRCFSSQGCGALGATCCESPYVGASPSCFVTGDWPTNHCEGSTCVLSHN